METFQDLRLAVLIDADNIPYANVREMLAEIAKYGTPTFKRIYGDWTRPTSAGWKSTLLENGITPVQQYSYTSGKNATDSAMIIDAMDILYTGRVEGFCLVSSDSDFTRLATRLREAGMKVYGIGERKTPVSFIAACDKFIYLEILKPAEIIIKTPAVTRKRSKAKVKESVNAKEESANQEDKRLINLISDSINDLADENGWAFLGDLGNLLLKKQPDFDPRNYGYKKLVPLIKSFGQFEVDERETGKKNTTLVYVRTK